MKLALSFLGGSLFSATAVVLAGGRPAGMLWLGAALALTTFGALVYLTGLRRVARFLNAFMDAMEGAVEKPRSEAKTSKLVSGKNKNPWGYVKPSAKQRDRDFANDLEFMKEEAQGAGEGAVTYEPVYQSTNRLERFEAIHVDWFAHIEFRERSAWGASWRGKFWCDQYWPHIEIGAAL